MAESDNADRFNDLIDSAIDALSDDSITSGCDVLVEIAQHFAAAGIPQSSFMDTRQYIINEATARTDAFFIEEKLRLAERAAQSRRREAGKGA